jgi:hypothetical protein
MILLINCLGILDISILIYGNHLMKMYLIILWVTLQLIFLILKKFRWVTW